MICSRDVDQIEVELFTVKLLARQQLIDVIEEVDKIEVVERHPFVIPVTLVVPLNPTNSTASEQTSQQAVQPQQVSP